MFNVDEKQCSYIKERLKETPVNIWIDRRRVKTLMTTITAPGSKGHHSMGKARLLFKAEVSYFLEMEHQTFVTQRVRACATVEGTPGLAGSAG